MLLIFLIHHCLVPSIYLPFLGVFIIFIHRVISNFSDIFFFRFPEKTVQIDPVVIIKNDPLPFEQFFLLFITRSRFEGNFAFVIDDPMPGQPLLFRTGMQNPDHVPDRRIKTRQVSDLAVRGHFPPGDCFDQPNNLRSEIHLILDAAHRLSRVFDLQYKNIILGQKRLDPDDLEAGFFSRLFDSLFDGGSVRIDLFSDEFHFHIDF
jgi:hypothetical protein